MPFTFECGVCHSIYRLDEKQITADGVKVTCPKCLNFFFLKSGALSAETPMIENLVKDGAYEVQMPAPKPSELTADDLFSDLLDPAPEPPPPPPPPPKKVLPEPEAFLPIKKSVPQKPTAPAPPKIPPAKKSEPKLPPAPSKPARVHTDPKFIPQGWLEAADTQITMADLGDYPADAPPNSKLDQFLIPFSVLILSISGLLLLNYQRWIKIPGLENLRVPIETPTPEPEITPISGVTPKPKYGFPVIPLPTETPTPSPTPTPTPTPSKSRR